MTDATGSRAAKKWDLVVTATVGAWRTYPPDVVQFKIENGLRAMGLDDVQVSVLEPEESDA
jgi:hypothetical protein